ncbi:MAG: hypothetical protein G01um1014106_105, partial [Parcubacteria group bacterium Gr01-1014_106]
MFLEYHARQQVADTPMSPGTEARVKLPISVPSRFFQLGCNPDGRRASTRCRGDQAPRRPSRERSLFPSAWAPYPIRRRTSCWTCCFPHSGCVVVIPERITAKHRSVSSQESRTRSLPDSARRMASRFGSRVADILKSLIILLTAAPRELLLSGRARSAAAPHRGTLP